MCVCVCICTLHPLSNLLHTIKHIFINGTKWKLEYQIESCLLCSWVLCCVWFLTLLHSTHMHVFPANSDGRRLKRDQTLIFLASSLRQIARCSLSGGKWAVAVITEIYKKKTPSITPAGAFKDENIFGWIPWGWIRPSVCLFWVRASVQCMFDTLRKQRFRKKCQSQSREFVCWHSFVAMFQGEQDKTTLLRSPT